MCQTWPNRRTMEFGVSISNNREKLNDSHRSFGSLADTLVGAPNTIPKRRAEHDGTRVHAYDIHSELATADS